MAEINIAQPMRFTVDVRNGLTERPQRESLMRGDKSANRIIVELMYGSEPFDITGVEVRGKFCRPPNGDEVGLTGTAEGNVATVQMTDQCYTSGGHYEASVSLVLGGVERTVLFISGDVLKSGSGSAAGDEEGGGSGSGLPSGGTAGQVLVKVSSAEGAAIWKTLTASDVGALPANGKAADADKLNGKSADEYLLKGSAIEFELLWENASPDSVFEEQTVPFSWGNHTHYAIKYTLFAGTNIYGFVGPVKIRHAARLAFFSTSSKGTSGYYRDFYSYEKNFEKAIRFIDGYEEQQDACVPFRIYGVKGVPET